MVELPNLAEAIREAGDRASGLATLAQSPTSRAAAGVLAERTGLHIDDYEFCGDYDLFECMDDYPHGIRIKTAFAIIAVRIEAVRSTEDAQALFEGVLGAASQDWCKRVAPSGSTCVP